MLTHLLALGRMLRGLFFALCAEMAYEQASGMLAHVLGVRLSTSCVARLVGSDAPDVAAFYEQQAPPALEEEAEVLVASFFNEPGPAAPTPA